MPERISSLANPQIKEVVRLREGKHRRRNGKFLIDGVREISRAVASRISIVRIFVEPKRFANVSIISENEKNHLKTLLQKWEREQKIIVHEVSPEVLDKMTFGERNEGILAVAETPNCPLNKLTLPKNPLVCVLEKIEKPGNVGAVFRSADGAGVDAVVVAEPKTDLFNPAAIRASVGTLFSIPSATSSADETLAWLRENRLQIIAAKCGDEIPYHEIDYTLPTAIVLGSEADGLTEHWNGNDIRAVKIPMLGIADSLNISTAAAILFYETRRQRKCKAQNAECEVQSANCR